MSLSNIYAGAAAECRVAARLFDNELPVWFEGHLNTDTDLIARLGCGHLCSIQVKLANYNGSTYSFHAGSYQSVDVYAVVAGDSKSYTIHWIPTDLVEANHHASLTEEFQMFNQAVPVCRKEGCDGVS